MDAATLLISALVLATTLALAGLRRVPEDRVVTVHRLGRYVRTLTPGLHWVLPGLDRIACRVPLIGHHLTLAVNAPGTAANADLYFQILEPLRVGADLEHVDDLVQRQADQALQAFSTDPTPLASGLAAASEAFKVELNRRIAGQGLRVIRCSLNASA